MGTLGSLIKNQFPSNSVLFNIRFAGLKKEKETHLYHVNYSTTNFCFVLFSFLQHSEESLLNPVEGQKSRRRRRELENKQVKIKKKKTKKKKWRKILSRTCHQKAKFQLNKSCLQMFFFACLRS